MGLPLMGNKPLVAAMAMLYGCKLAIDKCIVQHYIIFADYRPKPPFRLISITDLYRHVTSNPTLAV